MVFIILFSAGHGEHHAGLIVLLFGILDVASALQNLKGRVDLDGEVAEGMAELIDVELEGMAIA